VFNQTASINNLVAFPLGLFTDQVVPFFLLFNSSHLFFSISQTFFGGCIGVLTQGIVLSRQVLYHLSHTYSPIQLN
jgi:hypothetical protein